MGWEFATKSNDMQLESDQTQFSGFVALGRESIGVG